MCVFDEISFALVIMTDGLTLEMPLVEVMMTGEEVGLLVVTTGEEVGLLVVMTTSEEVELVVQSVVKICVA